MDNQDKIFDLIKKASQRAETNDFPSSDKIWSRVEEKLDAKALKTETKTWKKIAVAASVFLMVSVGYQFFKTEKVINSPENEIVTIDENKTVIPNTIQEKNEVVVIEKQNPLIKKNAEEIIKTELQSDQAVASNGNSVAPSIQSIAKDSLDFISESLQTRVKSTAKMVSTPKHYYKGRIFDAIGVHREYEEKTVSDSKKEDQVISKNAQPLIVIDGKAITEKTDLKILSDSDDYENVVILKEPLYIINKTYYTEEELFGTNSTSPYAPLDKQEIETISILQDEKAIAIYGEKGKKGVVIITTKNGKPLNNFKKSN